MNPLKNYPTSLVSALPKLAIGCISIALLGSLALFLPRLLTTRHLNKQHQQLKSEHAASQAKGEAEYTDYRIDSAALATQGQALHTQDSTLAQSEREIHSTRRPRFVLLPVEQLPREGAN